MHCEEIKDDQTSLLQKSGMNHFKNDIFCESLQKLYFSLTNMFTCMYSARLEVSAWSESAIVWVMCIDVL